MAKALPPAMVKRCQRWFVSAEKEELAGRAAHEAGQLGVANGHYLQRTQILRDQLFPCTQGKLIGGVLLDWAEWCRDWQRNAEQLYWDLRKAYRALTNSRLDPHGCELTYSVNPDGTYYHIDAVPVDQGVDRPLCNWIVARLEGGLSPGPFPDSSNFDEPWRMTSKLYLNRAVFEDCRHPHR